LEAHSATSAPPACSVTARFAVSVVTAGTREPLAGQGLLLGEALAQVRSTGMERSAIRCGAAFVGEADVLMS